MKKLSIVVLSLALGVTSVVASEMKCGAGKCGAAMQKNVKKTADDMKKSMKKCGAGKCGGSTQKGSKEVAKKHIDKCGGN